MSKSKTIFKYCVICEKEWGQAMKFCCADNTLIYMKKQKDKIEYFDINNNPMNSEDILKLKNKFVNSDPFTDSGLTPKNETSTRSTASKSEREIKYEKNIKLWAKIEKLGCLFLAIVAVIFVIFMITDYMSMPLIIVMLTLLISGGLIRFFAITLDLDDRHIPNGIKGKDYGNLLEKTGKITKKLNKWKYDDSRLKLTQLESKVVEIGKEIYDLGGKQLMLSILRRLKRSPYEVETEAIEKCWLKIEGFNEKEMIEAEKATKKIVERKPTKKVVKKDKDIEIHKKAKKKIWPSLSLAIMPYENQVIGVDSKDKEYDISRMKNPAIIYVPKDYIHVLRAEAKIYERITNKEVFSNVGNRDHSDHDPLKNLFFGAFDAMAPGILVKNPGDLYVKLVDSVRDAKMQITLGGKMQKD